MSNLDIQLLTILLLIKYIINSNDLTEPFSCRIQTSQEEAEIFSHAHTFCIYYCVYISGGMMEAKIFRSGNSQAVRIPKEFRLEGSVVEIFRRGDELVLRPKPQNLGVAFNLLASMPSDFMLNGRVDEPPQSREDF